MYLFLTTAGFYVDSPWTNCLWIHLMTEIAPTPWSNCLLRSALKVEKHQNIIEIRFPSNNFTSLRICLYRKDIPNCIAFLGYFLELYSLNLNWPQAKKQLKVIASANRGKRVPFISSYLTYHIVRTKASLVMCMMITFWFALCCRCFV